MSRNGTCANRGSCVFVHGRDGRLLFVRFVSFVDRPRVEKENDGGTNKGWEVSF